MAPQMKTSIVLAFVRLLSAVTSTADATTTTAMRLTTLFRALSTMIGTSKKTTTSQATRDRVSFSTMEGEKREMLGSRDILLEGCKHQGNQSTILAVGWWMMM